MTLIHGITKIATLKERMVGINSLPPPEIPASQGDKKYIIAAATTPKTAITCKARCNNFRLVAYSFKEL